MSPRVILTARSNRDYLYTATIAFLELLSAAILSININFFLFLALFLLCAIATLTSAEIRRSLGRTPAPPRTVLRRFHPRLAGPRTSSSRRPQSPSAPAARSHHTRRSPTRSAQLVVTLNRLFAALYALGCVGVSGLAGYTASDKLTHRFPNASYP